MNVQERLSLSLDDIIKKDKGKREKSSGSKRLRSSGPQQVSQRGSRASRRGGNGRGRGSAYSRRGGSSVLTTDVVMRPVATTNDQQHSKKSAAQMISRTSLKPTRNAKVLGGVSVNRRGLIGKRTKDVRVNGLSQNSASQRLGARHRGVAVYTNKANTSLSRRQNLASGTRRLPQRVAARTALRRPAAMTGRGGRIRNRNYRFFAQPPRRHELQQQQPFLGGRRPSQYEAFGSPSRQHYSTQASIASSSVGDTYDASASSSRGVTLPSLNSSLVKQIKIVAELHQVPPPLAQQRVDLDRRVGRFVGSNRDLNVGAQRKRPSTLSDRFS